MKNINELTSNVEKNVKNKSVLVVGDFFLDKYIYTKDDSTGVSLYTGGPAYVIDKTVCSPGAAGTVVKNFANLGYESVYALGIVGDDGDGFSLRKALRTFPNVTDMLITVPDRSTPCYTMIMRDQGKGYFEYGEASVQNYQHTDKEVEIEVIESMKAVINGLKPNAVVVLDQLDQEDCGVVTKAVRYAIASLKKKHPGILFYIDSRQHIADVDSTIVRKCNNIEFERSYNMPASELSIKSVSAFCSAPFIVTMGDKGTIVGINGVVKTLPAYIVEGKIDTRGAGDAFTAGYVTTRLCENSEINSVHLGNISAACCVSQIATTGYTTFADFRKMIIHSRKEDIQNEI